MSTTVSFFFKMCLVETINDSLCYNRQELSWFGWYVPCNYQDTQSRGIPQERINPIILLLYNKPKNQSKIKHISWATTQPICYLMTRCQCWILLPQCLRRGHVNVIENTMDVEENWIVYYQKKHLIHSIIRCWTRRRIQIPASIWVIQGQHRTCL